MKYFFYALSVVLAAPVLIGIADMWSWVVIGNQASGIDWHPGTVSLGLLFLFLALLTAIVTASVNDD